MMLRFRPRPADPEQRLGSSRYRFLRPNSIDGLQPNPRPVELGVGIREQELPSNLDGIISGYRAGMVLIQTA